MDNVNKILEDYARGKNDFLESSLPAAPEAVSAMLEIYKQSFINNFLSCAVNVGDITQEEYNEIIKWL